MARRRNKRKSNEDIVNQMRRIRVMAEQRGAYKPGTLSKDAATAQKRADKAKVIANRYETNINRYIHGVDNPLQHGDVFDKNYVSPESYAKGLWKKVKKEVYAAKAIGGQG